MVTKMTNVTIASLRPDSDMQNQREQLTKLVPENCTNKWVIVYRLYDWSPSTDFVEDIANKLLSPGKELNMETLKGHQMNDMMDELYFVGAQISSEFLVITEVSKD